MIEDEFSPNVTLRMTEIRGNHVAIVPSGRAGEYVKVLDAKPTEQEGETMKEELAAIGTFFKDLGLRLVAEDTAGKITITAPSITVTDAESDTVAKQKEKDAEALKLKERTMDEDMKKEKEAADKRSKDAEEKADKAEEEKKASDKRAKDAEEEVEKVKKEAAKEKEAVDARFKKLLDASEKLIESKKTEGGDAGACTCGADDGEAHKSGCPQFKEEAKDSDLIPVATLPSKDIPKNPIPGADAKTVEALRKLRPMIADAYSKGLIEKTAIDAFNNAMAAAKRSLPASAADYAALLHAAGVEGKDAKLARERSAAIPTGDAKPGQYEETMKKYHRQNPQDWGRVQ